MSNNHYQSLGVTLTSSPEEIRFAYRNLARIHHPDKHEGRTSPQMLAINEAWRVLSDPVLRYQYDASLRLRLDDERDAATAQTQERLRSIVDDVRGQRFTPAKFPWRFVLGIVGTATVAILVLGAFSNPGEVTPIDNVIRVGSCVNVDDVRLEAWEVECAGVHDGVVEQMVPFDSDCPYGSVAYRDRQGMGLACVVPV